MRNLTGRPVVWFLAGLATAYVYHKYSPGPKATPKKG